MSSVRQRWQTLYISTTHAYTGGDGLMRAATPSPFSRKPITTFVYRKFIDGAMTRVLTGRLKFENVAICAQIRLWNI